MKIGQLYEFDSIESWAESASNLIYTKSLFFLEQNGQVWIALSGGSTPFPVYSNLAKQIRTLNQDLQSKIHILLVDERSVPYTDSRNNGTGIERSFNDTNVSLHLMQSPENAPNAAYNYSLYLNSRKIDVLVLGMGEDGHTASLFPGTPSLDDTTFGYIVSEAPSKPKTRITMTFPVIEVAEVRIVLLKGKTKRAMLQRLINEDNTNWPIEKVLSDNGSELLWYWTE
jgi:6-phosphogluconolactonase